MHRTTVRRLAAAGLAAMVLFAAACGSDDDGDAASTPTESETNAADVLGPVDKASGTPVKVGLISDGKNAATDQSIELEVGDATVKYLNEHKGGLAGRPIQLVKCVTEIDPGKAADCANQMVEANVTAVTIGSSAVMESVWQPLHDAKIPMVFWAAATAKVVLDGETSFTMSSPTAGLIDLPIAVAKEEKTKKVTVVVIDVPAATSAFKTIAPPTFEKAGLELDVVTVPPGTADMTPQMQQVANGDPGVVLVVGNDSFCISAFNGLRDVGFTGRVTTIQQCVTDATRKSVPGDFLEGMAVASAAPVGGDDEPAALYQTVVGTYGKGIDTTRIAGVGMFVAIAGLASAMEDAAGDITPASIIAGLKAMPAKELPGTGLTFRCNGKAVSFAPATCVRASLLTTLDANGEPTAYEKVNDTPIED